MYSREWIHNKYALLRDAVKRLAEETGEPALARDFKVAQGNHINFYDDFMTAEAVDEDRETMRELIAKILAAAANPLSARARGDAQGETVIPKRCPDCSLAGRRGTAYTGRPISAAAGGQTVGGAAES